MVNRGCQAGILKLSMQRSRKNDLKKIVRHLANTKILLGFLGERLLKTVFSTYSTAFSITYKRIFLTNLKVVWAEFSTLS